MRHMVQKEKSEGPFFQRNDAHDSEHKTNYQCMD